jgi:putative DeoR family transcriptional regulator (stage III sporulation protein D)
VQNHLFDRALDVGFRFIETRETVRQLAKHYGVCKSTVHRDLTFVLPEIDRDLADQARVILDYHASIRHLRGGEATRMKHAL